MSSKLAQRRARARAAQLALLSLPVSALVAASPALAQPVNWTGMYVGFYAGGAWGRGNSTANTNCPAVIGGGPPGGYFCDDISAGSAANASAVTSAGSGSVSSTKFTGGIQAGYNWQAGSFVYGVEADFGAFNVTGSRTGTGVYPTGAGFGAVAGTAFTVTNSFDTDWLLTARGRLGWAASGWLVYATGGLAMSRVEVANSFADSVSAGGFSGATESSRAAKTKVGWTLGGGVEFALTRNWSIKGEYLYVDLGSVSTVGTVTHLGFVGYTNALGVSTDLTAHIARVGANFRF
jgi:outer membrane immunogenic protein